MPDPLLTVDDACALFQYSRSGFYRRLRRAGVRLAPQPAHRRFRRSDLEAIFVDRLAVVNFADLARAHARGDRRRA